MISFGTPINFQTTAHTMRLWYGKYRHGWIRSSATKHSSSSSMRGAKKIAAENNTRRELDKRVKRKRLKAKRLLNNISRWLVDFWLTPPIQWQWRARWDEKQRSEEKKKKTKKRFERLETIYHSSDRSPLSAWWWWVSEQEVAVDGMNICLVIG